MQVDIDEAEGPSNSVAPIYKARVVAKEYCQIEGVDFHEVFSLLVVKHSSITKVVAMA